MHTIISDGDSDFIEIKVQGFWTVDHVAVFLNDLRIQAAATRWSGARQNILYDYTGAAIQSQEVVGLLQDIARDDELRSRRVAIYTDGKLARAQARRVASADSRIRIFEDRRSAIDWLTAQ